LYLRSSAKKLAKNIFEIGFKHYFVDMGLRNSLVTYKPGDISKVLENLVFLQLKRQGYEVFVGQLKDGEIDFIAEKEGAKIYIQVAYLLENEKTINREFGNLLEIPDNYEKIVITLDKYAGKDFKGIKVLNALDFLAEDI
jgi:uncharacterized protein